MKSRKKRSRRVLRSYKIFGRRGERVNLGKSRKMRRPSKKNYKHAYVDKISEASDLDVLNAASLKRDLDILNAANIVPGTRKDYSVHANSRPESFTMDDDDDEVTDDIDPFYMQRRTRKRIKKQTRRRSRSRRIRRKW